MIKFILILALLYAAVEGRPSGAVAASGSVATSGAGSFLPFLSFENGNVGVNFGGYSASAGLGGLLTGNAAHGGLQASAGTPTGQKAVAGLGGVVNGEAGTSGGLYAGATAGNGVSAGTGLSGSTSAAGSTGVKFAGASAGNVGVHKTIITDDASPVQTATVYKTKTKIRTRSRPHHLRRKYYTYYTDYAPAAPAAYVEEEVYVPRQKLKQVAPATVEAYVSAYALPAEKEVVVQPVKHEAPPATIEAFAGTYVAEPEGPRVVKTVEKHKYKHNELIVEKPVESLETVYVEQPVYVQKPAETVYVQKPVVHKQVYAAPVSYGSAASSSAAASAGGGVASSAASSAAAGGGGGGASLGYSASYSHRNNGQLIRDIFNIPIATLGAVSNLASNAVKNNSFSFSKSLSASYAGR